MSSKYARLREQVGSLKSNTKKVYDAIPADKAWDLGQIVTVLAERGTRDRVIIQGSVEELVDRGLVKKSLVGGKHVYSAVRLREKPSQNEPLPQIATVVSIKPKETTQVQSHEITSRETHSDHMQMLEEVSSQLVSLSKRIENIALAVAEAEEARNKEIQAFNQLRSALAVLNPLK